MKKIFFSILFLPCILHAQVLYNNGGILAIKTGCTVQVKGSAQFQSSSTLINDGTLAVTGNIINNVVMPSANSGTLLINGSIAQTLSGTGSFFTKNMNVNNPNGLTLSEPAIVDGVFSFVNGLIAASSTAAPLALTANASISNTYLPTDASHVNGYVQKEGTGNFSYPVGDATRYQKTDVNLSANAGGMLVSYFSANAGTAPFTIGGTEALPLASYNTQEYWNIQPVSTATGTVKIYWDGYNDVYSNPVTQRRVAHKTGGNWVNEGSVLSATGTTASGSVTSNSISSWSPFALGSVGSVLPVEWISISGTTNNYDQAFVTWTIQEISALRYDVEKSFDGIHYQIIGSLPGVGNGTHTYHFTTQTKIAGTEYYRVTRININNQMLKSDVVRISGAPIKKVSIYPNPAYDHMNIEIPVSQIGLPVTLTDIEGRIIGSYLVTGQNSVIYIDKLRPGIYIVKFTNGSALRFIKR